MLALSRVRNPKGRMEDRKCEKLVDIRESVVSALFWSHENRLVMRVKRRHVSREKRKTNRIDRFMFREIHRH